MLRNGTPIALAILLGIIVTTADSAQRSSASTAGASSAETALTATRLRFVPAPTGNEVRYRVREQLVGLELPSDAVGATSAVTGAIVVETDGRVVSAESKFVVDLRTLKSDRDRRDNYLRRRTLVTDSFPTVELTPMSIRGLSAPLPGSGSRTFDLVADLTVRGVTRRTTWRVTAEFASGGVSGNAWTAFTFADAGLTQPRVGSVISVADSIRLEYDFRLVQEH